ncbi:MAG: phosphoribosylformylglycinamidine synthase, partial [Clostridia bacterium]|nr:phosphoribosylformylglycinamidine synthase [Clostridia bacterium]
MVFRVFVEKKKELANEARGLFSELKNLVGIEGLTDLRVINRYDVENIDEELFNKAVNTVFSEPQLDIVYRELDISEGIVFAVEPLPGQFDQRADSAAQCIQLQSQGDRPTVKSAKVYILTGELTDVDVDTVKKYVINAVESREASLEMPETLLSEYAIPETVATVEGFTELDTKGLEALLDSLGLAMDLDDLLFLQEYFRDEEKRDPTITEIRVVDTYWSDHCRHTTFSTHIDSVKIDDEIIADAYDRYLESRIEVYGEEKAAARPQTLMDIATIAVKVLKKRGELPELDESEEINACSIHVNAEINGEEQDWLLMFKNETHNHPTE